MPLDLYHSPLSASCRAVLMTANLIGVHVHLKPVDLTSGEQLKPEIVKLNPQHTVPILDDQGFHLSEGRAICSYLVNQYAKDDKLYPKDPRERAVVDQRLYFDLGVFYASFANYYVFSIIFVLTFDFVINIALYTFHSILLFFLMILNWTRKEKRSLWRR